MGIDSPCMMQNVVIENCVGLLAVPKLILRSSCLQHLKLYDIPSLTAFHSSGLPTSLQSLHIENCKNLSFLPPGTRSNYTCLVDLRISRSCDELKSFQLDGFPALQTLELFDCRSLDSIHSFESTSSRSSSLQTLDIGSHDSIELFEVKLKMDTLTALELLVLQCRELSFCEGVCLPSKLQTIWIRSQITTPPVTEWGLQDLTALSNLSIRGDDIVNTLMKEPLLNIEHLNEMKSFDGSWLQHLSSLESLLFWSCEKLESLLEDSLPDTLKKQIITGCPLLEERYKRKEHWSKISHIHVIHIDGQVTI